MSTTLPALDALLGGGWFSGDWHELMGAGCGVGEVSVLLPGLRACTARGGRVALIHPPFQPYAPALCAEGISLNQIVVIEPKTTQAAAWAAEHCLRALTGGIVLMWTQENVRTPLDDVMLRRLRRAAQLGRSVGIALRPAWAAERSSPASVRLNYESAAHGVRFSALKIRGGISSTQTHAHVALPLLGRITSQPSVHSPALERVGRVGRVVFAPQATPSSSSSRASHSAA